MFEKFDHIFTKVAGWIAGATGQPLAFILAVATVIVWVVSGPIFQFSDTWQLVINTGTTIVTFLMVFLIQNTQNRDSAAMQAKLDELLRAVENARESFIGIEHLTANEVEKVRAEIERECAIDDSADNKGEAVSRSFDKFVKRL